MQKDIKFIKSFFYELNKNKIRYCILRKANLILGGKAHDIDMVIDFSRMEEIKSILENLSKNTGWNLFLKSTKDNGNLITIHYYIESNKTIEIVHFDFFKNFSWIDIPLIKNEDLLSKCVCENGIYSCSKENDAITKLFSRYLYHGYIKEEYKVDIVDIFLKYEQNIKNIMSQFLEYDYSEKVYEFVVNKRWDELTRLNKDIKRSIKEKYLSSSYKKIIYNFTNISFKLKRYINYNGVMIAFIGTDGSGKSTIIENLPKVLGRTFDESQIKYYHWRPKYLKSLKGDKNLNVNVSEPHSKKPYGKVLSFLKFMYFNLDYIIGYWLSVKVHLGKNELVIFDRYYYDYLVDKYRYRLNLNDKIIKWTMRVIPKPHITFLLTGTPKVLYERKKEISLGEVEKQVNKVEKLKDILPDSKIINVDKNISDVVFEVAMNILVSMEKSVNGDE